MFSPSKLMTGAGGFGAPDMNTLKTMVENMGKPGRTDITGKYTETGLGSAARVELNTHSEYELATTWFQTFGFKAIPRAEDWNEQNMEDDELDALTAPGQNPPEEKEWATFTDQAFVFTARKEPTVTLTYVSDDLEGRMEYLRRAKLGFTMHKDRACKGGRELKEEVAKKVLAEVDQRVADKRKYYDERKKLVEAAKKEFAEEEEASRQKKEAEEAAEGEGKQQADESAGSTEDSTLPSSRSEHEDSVPGAEDWPGMASTDELKRAAEALGMEGGSVPDIPTGTSLKGLGKKAGWKAKLPPAREWEKLMFPSINALSFNGPGGLKFVIRRVRTPGTGANTSPLPGYDLDGFNTQEGALMDAVEAKRKIEVEGWWTSMKAAWRHTFPYLHSALSYGGPLVGLHADQPEEHSDMLTYVGLLVPLVEGVSSELVLKWMKRLGFDMSSEDNAPQDYVYCSDGQVLLAFLPDAHKLAPELQTPALLYNTREGDKLERRLKMAGLVAKQLASPSPSAAAPVPAADAADLPSEPASSVDSETQEQKQETAEDSAANPETRPSKGKSGKGKSKKAKDKGKDKEKEKEEGAGTATSAGDEEPPAPTVLRRYPTEDKKGTLFLINPPGRVPIAIAYNPESKAALYAVTACVFLFFSLIIIVVTVLAQSEDARKMVGSTVERWLGVKRMPSEAEVKLKQYMEKLNSLPSSMGGLGKEGAGGADDLAKLQALTAEIEALGGMEGLSDGGLGLGDFELGANGKKGSKAEGMPKVGSGPTTKSKKRKTAAKAEL